MSPRIICPHCHCSIDPHSLDYGTSDIAEFRICPACDEPIVLALTVALEESPAEPTVHLIPHAYTEEKLAL